MPSQSDTLETLGRAGYAVKGVLYALLGIVALRAAFLQTDPEGSSGLFSSLAEGTGGTVLLGVIALGLAAYALWRLALAALDPHGTAEAGERVYYAFSGLSYGFLAYQAAKLVLGNGGGGGGGGGTQERTETLLAQPFGQFLVGAVALIAAGYAVRQFYRAYEASFTDKLNLGSLSATAREWAVRAGRAGLAARGVVYGIVAYFLMRAALESSSARAKGLDGVLETLKAGTFGNILLGAVALGLIGYGVYCWLNARYRTYE